MASTTSTVAAATSSASSQGLQSPKSLKVVGIILAIISGLLIGSSFVFKKKGLLRSQAGALGEGVAYLKSPLWWIGMSMMILGELCNFAAYAFVEAIVVTPLGALSVVVCAILSSIFLNEKLSFFGWLGCGLCILGSVIIALNGPAEQTIGQIREFEKLFLAPGFLAYVSVLITASLVIVFYFAPKYGKKNMLWYIFVCSMIGGISVSVTTGLGAAIVQTARGDNQFKFWFMYFLFGFVAITLLVEVYYLNVALALFNTAMVTPTYYVIFTFFSMVTTIVLFKGLDASINQILTLVMGFLVICVGITILQMSKVDPEKLNKLDRRSTMLLQAARSQTETMDEKGLIGYEDPGMDTLRGSFGTVGSIIRARTAKRMSQSSHHTNFRSRPAGAAAPYDATASWMSSAGMPIPPEGLSGIKRHQLYDAPVPRDDASSFRAPSVHSEIVTKRPTIKFDSQDVVHQYSRPGEPQSPAIHEHRQAVHGSMLLHSEYPPLPPLPARDSTVSEGNLVDTVPSLPPPPPGPSTPTQTSIRGTPGHGQTLVLPPAISNEHSVQSAPASMYPRSSRTGSRLPQHKDSREIFDRSTMLTFPSVTDSSPSEWNDEELSRLQLFASGGSDRNSSSTLGAPSKLRVEKEKTKERERIRTPKKYPKGLDKDDAEESRGLVRRDTITSVEESDSEVALSPDVDVAGSIRLVQPSSKTHF